MAYAIKHLPAPAGFTIPKWTIDETYSVGLSMGATFSNYNKYDLYYMLNLMFSQYYSVIGNNDSYYVNMAKAFLNDTECKAFYYYEMVSDKISPK